MSTILEALKKASRARDQQRSSSKLLFRDSPYDRRTVTLERKRAAVQRRRRWFVMGFGAAAVAMLSLIALLRPREGEKTLASAGSPDSVGENSSPGAAETPASSMPSATGPALFATQGDDLPKPATPVVPAATSSGLYYLVPAPSGSAPLLSRETPIPLGDLPPLEDIVPEPEKTPRRASEPAKPKTPSMDLQGIVWSEERPMALINGQTVGIGDTISGARVVEITRSTVKLDRDGKSISLRM